MDINQLPPTVKFLTLAMFRCAIILKEMEKDKKEFQTLAAEIWDSMEMNGVENLKEAIDGQIENDIIPYVKQYIKGMKK